MQKYKEINGNDYVKNSRTTINETMQSIQSMNSGTAFPTNNLFEGMKCYRTDLKKTYTLTDVENNTWVEDAHATLSDEATHAASATKLQTARSLNLGGAVTADAATFDGTANATINVKTLDATKLKGTASVSTTGNAATASKLSTARKINITGNATGAATFDGTSDVSINVSVSQAAHADKATQDTNGRAFTDTNAYMHISALADSTDFNDVKTTGIYYCTGNTYPNRPHNSWGILTVYSIGTVKQEYRPDNAAVYYTREYNNKNWTEWSKVNAANADTATNASHATNADSATTATTATNATHASSADSATNATTANSLKETLDRPASANVTYNDGKIRYFLATVNMSEGKPPGGDGPVIHLSWDRPLWESQITINSPSGHIQTRTQDTGTWGSWKTVLDSDNFNNYAPTKTGGGASGTWGINISGNAASATNADNATKWNGIIDDHTTENNTDTWIPVFVDGKIQHTDRTKMTVGNADTVDGYHASDIINKISAANTGGIVAASLTENGYVKFANGLILQWGNMSVGSGRTETFSYPVKMSKVLFATTNPISGSNGRINNRVESPSSSECQVYNGSSDTSNMLILLLGLA